MDTLTKTGLDASKTASKKVFHQTAKEMGELVGNNVAEKFVKCLHLMIILKCSRNNYSNREKKRNIKRVEISIIKRNIIKYLNY